MKILCIVLCLTVSVLSGLLAYTAQGGSLAESVLPADEGVEDEGGEAREFKLAVGSQIGLIDELAESFMGAHEELEVSKLRLSKREKDLQELYTTYIKLRQEVETLIDDLDSRLVKVEESERKNFKKLSGVYSKMEPSSAAQALKHLEAERVALILSQMDSRSMAAIMDEAVSTSSDGSEFVAQWSDAIRRLNAGKSDA